MRIESLSGTPDRAGRHLLTLEDGSTMRVYPQVIGDFGLYPGIELGEDAWAEFLEAAGALSAKMRAVRIVSASAVSLRALEQRLVQKGESEIHAQQAVQWMRELDLVDDRETARQIVQRGCARGYGRARIKQMLYEKQIPKSLWDEVLEDMDDPAEAILMYLENHMPPHPDYKEKKKVIDALMRRGHSWQDVQRCLRQYGQDLEEFPEDTDG